MRVSRIVLIRLAVFMTTFYVWVGLTLYLDLQWRDRFYQQLVHIADSSIVKRFGASTSCYIGSFVPETRQNELTWTVKDNITSWPPDYQCNLRNAPANIQLELEWDSIDVSYPQYVLSVSGWIEMVTVSSWQPKPLKVIIVPHSHQDPGWLFTYDDYYRMSARHVLSLLTDQLTRHPNWTFIWSEVTYLAKWWSMVNQTERIKFKRLVRSGRVEIVTGGWVMPDEAVTHYTSLLGQLIEGNTWLKKHLNVTPSISWSIDPFGYSPTMAYLMKRNKAVAMVVQRIHYGVKKHLKKRESFEFFWRQTWADGDSTDILCHVMPFLSYDITHSCGPDPHVCCQFDFSRKKCYYGSTRVPAVDVTDENVEKLSWLLWEQFQKKSELFPSGVLLVPYGDDFRYETEREWGDLLGNMEKIVEYINKDSRMKMEVKFGTLNDYFHELKKRVLPAASSSQMLSDEEPVIMSTPQTLSGDFFPYTDRADQYWTGFYTSRPHLKAMSRSLQALLRSTEILLSMLLVRQENREWLIGSPQGRRNTTGILTDARRELGVFQHHDAITGTSKARVMADFGKRLHRSFTSVQDLHSRLVYAAGSKEGVNHDQHNGGSNADVTLRWTDHKSLPRNVKINITSQRTVLVHNTIAQERHDVLHLHVNVSNVKVTDKVTDKVISHQVSPVVEGTTFCTDVFELSFEIYLPPLSIRVFTISSTSNHDNTKAKVKVIKRSQAQQLEGFIMENYTEPIINISNSHLTAIFYCCNGRLQFITRKDGDTIKCEVKVMTYGTGSWSEFYKDMSGAYTFMPNGNAKDLEEDITDVYVISGAIYTQVITIQPAVLQKVTLYNTQGPLGEGLVVENIADIRHHNNTELILRLETDIIDWNHGICTDLNGFQMHRRKRQSKLKIQGNFLPITTMAFMESETERLTVLTASSRGVASLSEGWLEMVLDRRLMQHDWRGLNEGVTDNVPMYSKFVVLLEKRSKISSSQVSRTVCHPTALASLLSSQVENPPIVTMVTDNVEPAIKPETKFLSESFPCDLRLINIRLMEKQSRVRMKFLVILHRQLYDCTYPAVSICVPKREITFEDILQGAKIESVYSTSVTGNQLERKIDPKDIITIPPMEIQSYLVTIS